MAKSSPLVSIAMATYNGEKFITEQLESLVNQTYKNIEIVIVDDCSTDNTVRIIKDFQKKYGSITLIEKDSNSGITKTFEHAIRNCKGEYIALSDQDDVWLSNKIEILLDELGSEDAIYSNSLLVDKNGIFLNTDFKSLMNLQSYYSGAPFLLANCVPGHTILMKTEFAKTVFPFPDHLMFDRWISFCAASNNGIKYVDKPLVKYRQHDDNVIGTGKSRNKGGKKTSKEKFEEKLNELKIFERATIKSEETKLILTKMLQLFTRRWSIERSWFFFNNIDKILVIKNKSGFRKILYCMKMFFKANY